jgi:uncharacterized paraquat-inducible protein A
VLKPPEKSPDAMPRPDDTPLAIRCPDCGKVASLTPRQLRASLAAQCRQCKRDLTDVTGAALQAYDKARPGSDAEWVRRGGGHADRE